MARDPYKYYRIEAREIVEALVQGVLALEKAAASAEQLNQLLRLAHTLKGAARVVRQGASAELAHHFEDLLEPHRGGGTIPHATVDELLRLVDAIHAQLVSLDAPAAPARPTADADAPAPLAEPRFSAVRVELADMDRLLEGVSEAMVQLGALRQDAQELARGRQLLALLQGQLSPAGGLEPSAASLRRARALVAQLVGLLEQAGRELYGSLDRSEAELREVQDKANQLRLLPTQLVFGNLERAVHDAARSLGKSIRFEARGGEQRLDGHVLEPLADALLHLVRNAADHGIESSAEREAAGKPVQGLIELSVERRAGRLLFRCRDDGRGLDLEAIRAAAVRCGRASEAQAQALDATGAIQLLLAGGISTKAGVTEFSGRGIGLDTVRDIAARLKGSLALHSEPGGGTHVEVEVPTSLTALPALVVEAAQQTCALPLDAVRRTLRIAEDEVSRSSEGALIRYEGQALPFIALGEILGADAVERRRSWTVVIVEGRSGLGGIAVDRLVGHADLIVRPLPAAAGNLPLVLGASFDADGDPQPLLDAEGLVQSARNRHAMPAPVARSPPRILVIDDSLTTRMLEQSILESAGYTVELATSAEEGLQLARQRTYQLFVVDVEMPGMDGFEFIASTRRDPQLSQTPAILVSSRSRSEDRKRGAEVGARAYIVKGEFEQGRFLDTVRGLAG